MLEDFGAEYRVEVSVREREPSSVPLDRLHTRVVDFRLFKVQRHHLAIAVRQEPRHVSIAGTDIEGTLAAFREEPEEVGSARLLFWAGPICR